MPHSHQDSLRDEVWELERERVTVQEAARRLGITESAVRKRAGRGQIRSDKVTEGKRERLYIFLDPEVDIVPEPFRDRYMNSLEDRVRSLEDEVFRQQAIILSMTQSLQALTGASEAPEMPSQTPESPRPSATPPAESGGPESGAERVPRWLLIMTGLVFIVGLVVLTMLLFLGLAGNAFISQPGGIFGG